MQIRATTLLIIIGIAGVGILSLNTLDVLSANKKDLAVGFDESTTAQSVFVTIKDATNNKEISFNTFSRIGVVRSINPAFLLESIPSIQNKEFLKFVSQSLTSSQKSGVNLNPQYFDVSIDVLSKDGNVIETLKYKRCTIEYYFIYNTDSRGLYSLLGRDTTKSEIRDVTKFDCT